MADIIEVIKKASREAEEQNSPTNVLFGTVISTAPLQIQVEQKLTLTREFLILTKNVVDYDVKISLKWNTNSKNLNANHMHGVEGDIQVSSSINPNKDNQTISNQISSNMSIQNTDIELTHNHEISGTKTITIHNALEQNDKVILIQQRGGQKFIVLDKIY